MHKTMFHSKNTLILAIPTIGVKNHEQPSDFSLVCFLCLLNLNLILKVFFYHIVILMISNNFKSSKNILRISMKSIIFIEIIVEKIKFESSESDKYFTYI